MLIGNLGRDPEVRYTGSGAAVANFTLATNEVWTNKEGRREEHTEWHRIVVFGKTAEVCREYLKKGRQVYLEGRLQTRQWEDREGNKRTTTEIVASNIVFLGRGGETQQVDSAPPAGPTEPSEGTGGPSSSTPPTDDPFGGDTIPF